MSETEGSDAKLRTDIVAKTVKPYRDDREYLRDDRSSHHQVSQGPGKLFKPDGGEKPLDGGAIVEDRLKQDKIDGDEGHVVSAASAVGNQEQRVGRLRSLLQKLRGH